MSATINSTSRLSVMQGTSELLGMGSSVEPTNPTTCEGTAVHGPRTITLDPGDTFTLWSYPTDGDLAFMEIRTTGFCWLSQKVDAPTSDTDHTASGTKVNYPKEGLSCTGTHRIQGMVVPVVASATNYAGSHFHSSAANGRRYEIAVKNPSDAEDPITVTWAWTN